MAIAFDIDGVFKYGRNWSKDGLETLQRATQAKIPFVFVTNGGGGLTEEKYGSHLKEKVLAAGSAAGPLVAAAAALLLRCRPPVRARVCVR